MEKMILENILSEETIKLELNSKGKREVLEELVDVLEGAGQIHDKAEVLEAILERESLMSTGIGDGVAIPHAKSGQVKGVVAAFGCSREGVDYDALDGKPVHLIFLLIAQEEASTSYLKALAQISRFLKHRHFREKLMRSKDAKEVLNLIKQEESKYL
jgi:fructose-specific phosphotransferase system IIA component